MKPSGSLLFGLSPSQQTVVSWTLNATSGAATQASTLSVGTLPDLHGFVGQRLLHVRFGRHRGHPELPQRRAAGGRTPGPSPNFYVYTVASNGVLSPILGQSTSPVFNENADLLTGSFPAQSGGRCDLERLALSVHREPGNAGSSISVFRIATSATRHPRRADRGPRLSGHRQWNHDLHRLSVPLHGCSGPSFAAVSKINNALYVLDPNPPARSSSSR